MDMPYPCQNEQSLINDTLLSARMISYSYCGNVAIPFIMVRQC